MRVTSHCRLTASAGGPACTSIACKPVPACVRTCPSVRCASYKKQRPSIEQNDSLYDQLTRSEAVQITLNATKAPTWLQLSDLFSEHKDKLWHINLAAIFTQLRKVVTVQQLTSMSGEERDAFSAFYTRLSYTTGRALQGGMQPRELCTVARGAAGLGAPQPWLCHALEDASLPFMQAGRISLRHLAQLTYSFAQMQHQPQPAWVEVLWQASKLEMARTAVHVAMVQTPMQPVKTPGGGSKTTPRKELESVSHATHAKQRQRGTTNQAANAQHQTGLGNVSEAAAASQSLANLAHACVCRMGRQPEPAWVQVWFLACEPVMDYAQGQELVQMLQIVGALSCRLDSTSSPHGLPQTMEIPSNQYGPHNHSGFMLDPAAINGGSQSVAVSILCRDASAWNSGAVLPACQTGLCWRPAQRSVWHASHDSANWSVHDDDGDGDGGGGGDGMWAVYDQQVGQPQAGMQAENVLQRVAVPVGWLGRCCRALLLRSKELSASQSQTAIAALAAASGLQPDPGALHGAQPLQRLIAALLSNCCLDMELSNDQQDVKTRKHPLKRASPNATKQMSAVVAHNDWVALGRVSRQAHDQRMPGEHGAQTRHMERVMARQGMRLVELLESLVALQHRPGNDVLASLQRMVDMHGSMAPPQYAARMNAALATLLPRDC